MLHGGWVEWVQVEAQRLGRASFEAHQLDYPAIRIVARVGVPDQHCEELRALGLDRPEHLDFLIVRKVGEGCRVGPAARRFDGRQAILEEPTECRVGRGYPVDVPGYAELARAREVVAGLGPAGPALRPPEPSVLRRRMSPGPQSCASPRLSPTRNSRESSK